MTAASDELSRRIRLGEDSMLELKSVLLAGRRVTGPKRGPFADELASMANGSGGTIVLGVDDETRDILGIPIAALDTVETWAREICNDSIEPPLDAAIRKMELGTSSGETRAVIRIDVPRSLFVHKSPGGYFRRIGSSRREMRPELLARLFQERSQSRLIRFDESVVPGTEPSALDERLIERFMPDAGTEDDSYLLKLRLICTDEDDVPRLTVAGVLVCTSEPGQWLPHAHIQAVCYAGARADINYQIDAKDFVGPLDSQVVEALRFVKRNMRVSATKVVARVDVPQFSEKAIFEALVNAVAHRDYSMAGARIRLHMFRDRLELYVPGGLPNTLTTDSLHLRQYNRNELIVSLLARCDVPEEAGLGRRKMMERRGDGVPIIRDETRELSGRLPEYSLLDDSELLLVIRGAKAFD